jgi:hypothetical protein
VEALVACLLREEPGLGCPLADGLISAVFRGEPAHYVGVLSRLTADSQVRELMYIYIGHLRRAKTGLVLAVLCTYWISD